MTYAAGARTNGELAGVVRQLVLTAWATLYVLFAGVAVVFVVRRFSGVFVQGPTWWMLMAAAGAACAIAAVLRWPIVMNGVALRAGPRWTEYLVLGTRYSSAGRQFLSSRGFQYVLFALPGLAAALLLGALSWPDTSVLFTVLAWFLLIAAEAASWWAIVYADRDARPRSNAGPALKPAASASEQEIEPELPPGLVQQISRVREGGYESIHAISLAEIPAGDRLAILHLSFCPPLDRAPELTAHAVEADDVQVRVTQAETFGTRLEVLAGAKCNEPRAVVVEVLGKAPIGASTP